MGKSIAIGFLAILCIISITMGISSSGESYDNGYDAGFNDALIENTPDIPEYEPPMTDDERMMLLLEDFIDGISTANITIEFDNEGNTSGHINIYYDRVIDSIITLEPAQEPTTLYEYSEDGYQFDLNDNYRIWQEAD